MNEQLKQRLVGALILVALGVVFWPIIFVESDPRGEQLDARIPPRPAIDTSPLASPDRAGLRGSPPLESEAAPDGASEGSERPVADDPATGSDPTDDDPVEPAPPVAAAAGGEQVDTGEPASGDPVIAGRARESAPERPQTDAQGVPVAWMLQVMSVTRKDGAEKTRQALEEMGYKAYIKPARVGGKTVYRVYLGPKFERAEMDALKRVVDKRFGVNSMVRRYLP